MWISACLLFMIVNKTKINISLSQYSINVDVHINIEKQPVNYLFVH